MEDFLYLEPHPFVLINIVRKESVKKFLLWILVFLLVLMVTVMLT